LVDRQEPAVSRGTDESKRTLSKTSDWGRVTRARKS